MKLDRKTTEQIAAIAADEGLDLLSGQQDGMGRVTAHKAPVAPDGHESALVAPRGAPEPVGVLAPLADAIDEGAGKYIVILQPNSRAALDRVPEFT